MDNSATITYREFWDVPRIFFTVWHGHTVLFDCAFDEEVEDYPNYYRVYLLPPLSEEDVAGSWAALADKATEEIGNVPIDKVVFDPSRRTAIDATLLNELLETHESRSAVSP